MHNFLSFDYHQIEMVVSGGQHGADLGGLLAAKDFGIKTGGFAPKGWRTCQGANPSLAIFNLRESHSPDFTIRTKQNIAISDGTIIFASNINSPGTRLTIKQCTSHRPFLICDIHTTTEDIINWVTLNNIRILNVAGNRDFVNPKFSHKQWAQESLSKVFSKLADLTFNK